MTADAPLADLEAVPWASLATANGTGAALPGWLEDLAGLDPQRAEGPSAHSSVRCTTRTTYSWPVPRWPRSSSG